MSKGAFQCENASYGLYTGESGGLVFYVSDGTRVHLSADAGAGIWDGDWHTVRGAFDGGQLRLYVDGAQVGTSVPAAVSVYYGMPDRRRLLPRRLRRSVQPTRSASSATSTPRPSSATTTPTPPWPSRSGDEPGAGAGVATVTPPRPRARRRTA